MNKSTVFHGGAIIDSCNWPALQNRYILSIIFVELVDIEMGQNKFFH